MFNFIKNIFRYRISDIESFIKDIAIAIALTIVLIIVYFTKQHKMIKTIDLVYMEQHWSIEAGDSYYTVVRKHNNDIQSGSVFIYDEKGTELEKQDPVYQKIVSEMLLK